MPLDTGIDSRLSAIDPLQDDMFLKTGSLIESSPPLRSVKTCDSRGWYFVVKCAFTSQRAPRAPRFVKRADTAHPNEVSKCTCDHDPGRSGKHRVSENITYIHSRMGEQFFVLRGVGKGQGKQGKDESQQGQTLKVFFSLMPTPEIDR